MNLSLSGRSALVCGSTQGIGYAAAVELSLLGANVTLLARNADKLKTACEALPRAAHPPTPSFPAATSASSSPPPPQKHAWAVADFSDLASVRAAAAELIKHAGPGATPFHILINNTGGPPGGLAIDAAPEQFLATFSAHLIGSQILTQALVPGMKSAKFGRIVNIISTSVKAPIPNLGVSNTVRAAVASWAKTLAGELGPFGITVNNVLPGYTQTERLTSLMSGRASKSGLSEQQVAAELIATIPAGRFGTAQELGAAVAFLCTPAAAYINGINLPVDGGRLPSL